jgi:2,4-dienoyl-CoA reductase-like NADH-dependent reductase (Old Yellow Enzyme family)/thioredoxin reductase
MDEGHAGDVAHGEVAPGFRRLFEPIRIGNFTVRNRIVNTTHGTGLGEARDLRHLQERARGGVGLIGLHASQGVSGFAVGPGAEHVAPDWDEKPLSPVTAEGIRHYDTVAIPYIRTRAAVVHAEGAKCFAQVYHAGAAPHAPRIHPPLAPSEIGDPYEALAPHPLTEEEIETLIVAFAHGIRRAREAGVDAAEIHAAHGYLVHQFLSPYFNRRDDRWGGTRENRSRFAVEVIRQARAMVGTDFPIGIRVGLDGDGERGLTVTELAETCRVLSPHVDYISVSGGNYSGFGDGFEVAYVSPWYKEPGFNVPAAAAVRARVDVPVMVTGRIVDPSIAEGILADGAADMVGMVRALIADPELPNKVRQGRSGEIRMCLGMSECHYIGPRRVPVTCAVNAAAAREAEMEVIPAEVTKTVVVVGAGPAGMEAACVAARRGHHVYLCDKARTIGGTVRLLAADPNRRNLRDHAVYFDGELRRLKVDLMLGNEVTADELIAFGPDAVVVATGGVPAIPDVPGVRGPGVLVALDLVADGPRPPILDKVLVVGGLDDHIGAPTMAELLADQGRTVELITEHVDFAPGAEDGTRLALLSRLMNKGVTISTTHKLARVDSASATVVQTFTGAQRRLEDVSVVLACGLFPDDRLARQLRGHVPEIHVIGDALAPRRMMHATLEGARVGNAL